MNLLRSLHDPLLSKMLVIILGIGMTSQQVFSEQLGTLGQCSDRNGEINSDQPNSAFKIESIEILLITTPHRRTAFGLVLFYFNHSFAY